MKSSIAVEGCTKTPAGSFPQEAPDKASSIRSIIGRSELFCHLSHSDLAYVAHAAKMALYDKGELIFSEGDDAVSFWILVDGRVELLKYSSNGKSHAIETVYPGKSFGSVYAQSGREVSCSTSAVAYVNSHAIELPFSAFTYLLRNSPAFVLGLCANYNRKISDMQSQSILWNVRVPQRIANTLIRLASHGNTRLSITKREIAELANTSVETAIRTLGEFEKKRWISSSRGEICLLQLETIRTFSMAPV